MYNMPIHKDKDAETVMAFIREHSFGVLTGVDADQKPVATQLPFLIVEREGELYLRAHIMKGTDHHKAFLSNPHVLVLFTSPHCYVSASWYENPLQASTWNYMTVQVKGELRFLDDAELPPLLAELTAHYEKQDSRSMYEHLPKDYVARLNKAIVALEVKATAVEHVFKLSQNRDAQSFRNILSRLEAGTPGEQFIAAEMRKRQPQ